MNNLLEKVKRDEKNAKLVFASILALLTMLLIINTVDKKTLLDFWILVLLIVVALLSFVFLYSQTNLFGMKPNYEKIKIFRDLTSAEKEILAIELNQAGWVKRNLVWVIIAATATFLLILFLIIFIANAPNPSIGLITDFLVPVSIILVLYPTAILHQGSRYKSLKLDIENKVYESEGRVKIIDQQSIIVNGLLFRGFESSFWSEIKKSEKIKIEFSLMTKTLWKVNPLYEND